MQRGSPMNCFPTQDHDLENRPLDPARYARVLEVANSRGMAPVSPSASSIQPDSEPERWSIEDAAAHWLPAWVSPKHAPANLSADAIMGLVAMAFLRHYVDLPLLRKFFWNLCAKVHPRVNPGTPLAILGSTYASLFCRGAHAGFRPGVAKLDEKYAGTGFRAVASKTLKPCSLECCREAETVLGGCISRESFDNAVSSGILLPVRMMNASPISLLLPRLASWEESPPSIAIRQAEVHTKALYAPYWVHDAINNMARVIPALLSRPEVRAEIRAGVELLMPKYLMLKEEAAEAESSGRIPARTSAARDEHIANLIWQSSGAEPTAYRQNRGSLFPPRRFM